MVLGLSLFITEAVEDPVFFFSVVLTVVVSVVLHELGHVRAATWQGDPTPRAMGHDTLDPLVHMGPLSLVALFLIGIAWGQTPVDPTRFRSRWGDALVSGAGPAVNLLLALLGLTALGLWQAQAGLPDEGAAWNFMRFLALFGVWNLVLLVFNLIPVPPLDGANVAANLLPFYRRWVRDPDNQGVWTVAFLAIFLVVGRYLVLYAMLAGDVWVQLLGGPGVQDLFRG